MRVLRKTAIPILGLGLGLAILALVASAAKLEPIGRTVLTKGEVVAVDATNKVRSLARGAAIFPLDTLRTGAEAAAQFRFIDNAVVALREQTEFRVDSYRYDARNAGISNSVATLIKGGFRTVTGAIAKLMPQTYKVHTAVAVLGVRGTSYEALLRNGLYVAVYRGTVVIENKAGTLLVGEGTPYKFAYVPDINTAPQGLLQAPAELNLLDATQQELLNLDNGLNLPTDPNQLLNDPNLNLPAVPDPNLNLPPVPDPNLSLPPVPPPPTLPLPTLPGT